MPRTPEKKYVPSSAESLPSKPLEHIPFIEALQAYLIAGGHADLAKLVDRGEVYAVEGFLLGELEQAKLAHDDMLTKQLRQGLRTSNWKSLVPDRTELTLLAKAAAKNLEDELQRLATLVDARDADAETNEAAEEKLREAIQLIKQAPKNAATGNALEPVAEACELVCGLVHQLTDEESKFLAASGQQFPAMTKNSRTHRDNLLKLLNQLRRVRDDVLYRMMYPNLAANGNQPPTSR